MIKSKKELKFCISADYMMNRGYFKEPILKKIISVIYPDWVMKYLIALRKAEFYSTIAENVFGYGLVIPHYGTIVVGSGNRIGNYAVLHTSTCITAGKKNIGDGLYLSTGAKVLGDIELGNFITIGANAVVNKSEEGNCLLIGIPAEKKRYEDAWMKGLYRERYEACEKLRQTMFNSL